MYYFHFLFDKHYCKMIKVTSRVVHWMQWYFYHVNVKDVHTLHYEAAGSNSCRIIKAGYDSVLADTDKPK